MPIDDVGACRIKKGVVYFYEFITNRKRVQPNRLAFSFYLVTGQRRRRFFSSIIAMNKANRKFKKQKA